MIPLPQRPRRAPAPRATTTTATATAPAPATAAAATIAVAFAFALALSSARPSAPPARAQGPTPQPTHFENVTLLSGGHHVFAKLSGVDESTPTRWVEAALLPRAGACTAPACDPDTPRATAHAATIYDGSLEFAFVTAGPFQRRPVRLAPGDRVRLRTIDGGAPAEEVLTVGDVTVTAIDVAADRLTGTGPAGGRVSITANRPDGEFAFTSATVGTDGTWTAALVGKIDLVPGSSGAATAGVDGVVTQASWGVRVASVRVGGHAVEVWAPTGDATTATLRCMDRGVGATGSAIAWAGMSMPNDVALRDAGGNLAALNRSGICPDLALTTGTPGAVWDAVEGAVEVRLPEGRLSLDLSGETVTGSAWWAVGTYQIRAAGVERTVAVTETRIPWSVSFAGAADLTELTPVDLVPLTPDAAFSWTLRGYARRVTHVDPRAVRVAGRGVAGDIVTIVARGDGVRGVPVGTTVIGPDGTFDVSAAGDGGGVAELDGPAEISVAFVDNAYRVVPPDVLAPDSVQREAASPETVYLQTAPLRAAALANRDVVHGAALPGARITVQLGEARDDVTLAVVAGPDGAWQADFTDLADLMPGMPVAVEATAADGYRSTLSFPVFRASAQVGGDRVIVEGHPGLVATVEVARGGEIIGGAECTVGDDAAPCIARVRESGFVTPLVLRPDDEVVVLPNEGASASLRLVPFSAHVDTSARSVVGNCPPNGRMLVRFRAPEGSLAPFDSSTTADGNGVCDYELARGEWELMQPGLTAELIHPLADGHRLFSTGVYEHVRMIHNGPIEGLAEPFTVVTLTVRSAAGVDRRLYSVRADGDGRWTSDLPGANRNVHRPEPGGALLVDDARRRHILPYTPLVGWWDDRIGSVVGLTIPDQPVKIVHDLTPQVDGVAGSAGSAGADRVCHGLSDFATKTDIADPLGTFAFAAPPADACALGRAELAVLLPSGDEVRFRLPTDVRPGGRLYLPIGHAGRP